MLVAEKLISKTLFLFLMIIGESDKLQFSPPCVTLSHS